MRTIETEAISLLKQNLRGELLLPGVEGYDQSRTIWNGMFDRKPALIVKCADTNDVIQAVNFARKNNLLLSVKSGGHNSAGTAVCDGGIMIDLSPMNKIVVDAQKKTATVEGGCLLADVDRETQRHGLAVSSGIVSHTGVGGLTLGGGFGWISRKYGFSIDNLLSAQVVTADGKLVTASAKENEDLFWGIRGGGGNFGIVTSFEFKCAEIGNEVFSGLIVKKFESARAYIQFHREYVRQLPDEMTVWMVVRHAPPLPFLPADVHGKLVVIVPFVWLGDQAKGEQLIAPVRNTGKTAGEAFGMNPWPAWQSGFDPLVSHGARNYWKSHHLKNLDDGCIDQILSYATRMPTEECEVFIPHMEGAASRVPEDATAFTHRKPPFVVNIHTRWQKAADDERCISWARDFHTALQPFSKGVYVNFISEEGPNRVKDAYSEQAWERLVRLKDKYDPDNLFRMNQNIKPSKREMVVER